jgi:hypothetical protein
MENYPDYETVEYHLIYSELIRAARHRGTVTYQELAHVVGLPLTGNYMGKRLGAILGAISQNEYNQGRPLLSALGVTTAGKPGGGFFTLAQEFDLLETDDPAAQNALWENQVQECYDTWQQRFSK